MKKSLLILAAATFLTGSLGACGSRTNAPMMPQQMAQPQVNAQSFKGVYNEVNKTSLRIFNELDADGDKKISVKEYDVNSADKMTAFRKLDNNKDGFVSKKEFTPGFFSKMGQTFSLRSTASKLFKKLDVNRDKHVTEAELGKGVVSTQFTELFSKYDVQKKGWFRKNPQGRLSKSEFENLFAHIVTLSLDPRK